MLEDYEKSGIANNAYMKKIMQVLGNGKETKKIMNKPNQYIIQISDGKNSVNIYKKGKCYCINLDGTNFSSIIAAEGGAYLYKNKKLGIEYKLSEIYLDEYASKRTIIVKVKDYEYANSYIDDNGDFIFIYCDGPSEANERITIYDKTLVGLDEQELANFINVKNNTDKSEKQDDIMELPKNVEDFDYSKYEEENEIEDINLDEDDELDDIKNQMSLEQLYEMQSEDFEKYCENYVCMINGEEVDEEERIQLIQNIDTSMQDNDDNFIGISESIEEIIATYESEREKFEPKVNSTKNISNEIDTQTDSKQNDDPEQ